MDNAWVFSADRGRDPIPELGGWPPARQRETWRCLGADWHVEIVAGDVDPAAGTFADGESGDEFGSYFPGQEDRLRIGRVETH
jgi:hypothetical protein